MQIDTRLPLEANARPLDTATPIQQMGQQQNQNALTAEELLKRHYQNIDDREKSRLSSTIAGAYQLKSFLDNDDMEGANTFLSRRKAALMQRIGSGENIDTQETDYALQALKSGNIDELRNDIDGLLAAGRVYGILDQNTAGGDTGILIDRLIKEGSAKNVQDALEQIKGGAGQAGRNAADISSGRMANYETTTGGNISNLEYAPQEKVATEKATGYQDFISNQYNVAKTKNQQAIDLIGTILSDDGKTLSKDVSAVVGFRNPVGGAIPMSEDPNMPGMPRVVGGSPAASGRAKLQQLKGQVFLEAYESLRGAGALTNIEGLKGEQAKARLDIAQSEEDYVDAIKDLQKVLISAQSKLESRKSEAENYLSGLSAGRASQQTNMGNPYATQNPALTTPYDQIQPVISDTTQKLDFNSVEEAESANLPSGTEITIRGRRAVID